MTFKELDVGDYFIQWHTDERCFLMYRKNSEYDACYVVENLNEKPFVIVVFGTDDIVYKVIV